jgi:hypothetical protein
MESSPHIRAVSNNPEPEDSGSSSPPPDVSALLTALREAAAHESDKEERLENKTRAAVTIAGAYFAIVQTATFSSSGALGKLEGSSRTWTISLAIAAIVALAIAIFAAVKQQWPRKHRSLPSRKIGEEVLDVYDEKLDEREVLRTLVGRYARVTKTRKIANDQRVKQYNETGIFCLLAIVATSAELIVALLTRL